MTFAKLPAESAAPDTRRGRVIRLIARGLINRRLPVSSKTISEIEAEYRRECPRSRAVAEVLDAAENTTGEWIRFVNDVAGECRALREGTKTA